MPGSFPFWQCRDSTPSGDQPLSHSPQIHQEWVLQSLHDLQLPEHVPHLIPLHALLFVHVFHRIHLLCVSLLHDAYLQGSPREQLSEQAEREEEEEEEELQALTGIPVHVWVSSIPNTC